MNILRLMTPKSHVAYLLSDASIRAALEKMRHHGHHAIPVLDSEGRYVGMVKDGDFLWYLMDSEVWDMEELEKMSIAPLIRKTNPAVLNAAPMEELLERSTENNFVPLVDDRGCFIGIVKRKEVLSYFSKIYLKKEDPSTI